ncbi:HNH endonuclease [Stappia sp. ES.058]|uniref:HNH endonuclease n=1 Tax=Stappia sp. ES.058 TaxID=1881061 RepID=UPI000B8603C4|nr:HNH endonuclease [Stappia sp. ES.058]
MVQAIFHHKTGSDYDDVAGQQYHFPKRYLSRVEKTLGDWIIYYGPTPGKASRYYSGIARVSSVRPDTAKPGHHYAYLRDYLDFDRLVDYAENGGYERKLVRADGTINGGTAQNAVRLLQSSEFYAIVMAGLSAPEEWPAREDAPTYDEARLELDDTAQKPFLGQDDERRIVSQLLNRPFRDAKFRQNIRTIYDRTCAFTGLRLINGHGRPEVEAAHIVPVDKDGSDSVRNGIALSGTVHWMFDRGLLSLTDDYTILASRHLNYDVSHLLHRDMKAKVPAEPHLRPHPHCLGWHRENVFKQ